MCLLCLCPSSCRVDGRMIICSRKRVEMWSRTHKLHRLYYPSCRLLGPWEPADESWRLGLDHIESDHILYFHPLSPQHCHKHPCPCCIASCLADFAITDQGLKFLGKCGIARWPSEETRRHAETVPSHVLSESTGPYPLSSSR